MGDKYTPQLLVKAKVPKQPCKMCKAKLDKVVRGTDICLVCYNDIKLGKKKPLR